MSFEEVNHIANSAKQSYKPLLPNILRYFPNINNLEKLIIPRIPITINPYWLSGFVDGDGSFSLSFHKPSISSKFGFYEAIFTITQHSRDLILMEAIKEFLNCGRIYKNNNRNQPVLTYKCSSQKDLSALIIPHFIHYPLYSTKFIKFVLWHEALTFMFTRSSFSDQDKLYLFQLHIRLKEITNSIYY